MRNALTVDLEDWFHVSNLDGVIARDRWDEMPSRVVDNTRRLLDLFDVCEAKATFFVLGWVAERQPGLVEEIHTRGHELGSHGYGHELVYRIGPERFSRDLDRSLDAIEAAAGVRPLGYRAPSFSIDARSVWAFDVLAARGVQFDSSVFPVWHPRYGFPAFSRVPRRIRTPRGTLISEFPLTTLRALGRNLGAAGGAYLRLLPLRLLEVAFDRMNAEGHPAVLYVHPWEIDPGQPRVRARGIGCVTHYANLALTESRVRRMLRRYHFGPMSEVLGDAPGLSEAPVELVA